MKTILVIIKYIGAIVCYMIIISIGVYLLESKIVNLQWAWLEYPYYFGLGIMSWFPCNYILDYKK